MCLIQRGAQLGEEQIKSPLKSIFDYMSEKSKERLALFAASKQEAPPSTGLEASKPDPASLRGVEIPHLSPRTASAALMGFIPFGDDPAKQQRYRSYLVSQTHNTTSPNPELLPSKSIDHINKELQDFSKSATIFKPMSFAMANRFTSSKVSAHDMKQPEAGLHMPDPDRVDTWKDKAQQEAEIQEILTPKQEAARSGMYGNLTRTVESFYPNKLLCKRFGVADPYPDGPPGKAPGPTAGSSSDIAAISATPADLAWTEKYTHKGTEVAEQTEASSATPPTRRPRTLAEVGMADDDNQGGDILTYKKPSIDIFRAIFQDDDSDENDDDDDDDNEDPLESTASASMLSKPAIPLVHVPPITPLASEPLEGQNDRLQSEAHRPIFQIRTKADTAADEESSRDREATKAKSKAKKKREKTKTSTKILMSFDVGDEGEDDTAWTAAPKRKRERDTDQSRSGKKHREDPIVPVPVAVGDEEDEWVEKDVLGPLAPPPGATSASTSIGQSGRKKASDFM
jgi:G patch domain-containing protein 1